jgi:hypothetical protein
LCPAGHDTAPDPFVLARSNTRKSIFAYDSVGHARVSLGRYIDFYNGKRRHSSLDARTPDRAYFDGIRPLARAA